MLTNDIVEKLRIRYPNLHPLIFHRSLERARNDADLFDILDSFVESYPIVWCEETHRWITSDDILQTKEFLN